MIRPGILLPLLISCISIYVGVIVMDGCLDVVGQQTDAMFALARQ